ncbi:hypothetical protein [Kutzneria albida]|uniref:Uncharacterized protein n=1 Tax=Kutzneria albida DSM 43870 TaxID=1449976 RepID=W5WB16_9PSEU|nr:hypothetical protein [Kutzneria albida]AHH98338.1 hypothetical protein KALB_4976 [Kutzneria albida DSM 43870]
MPNADDWVAYAVNTKTGQILTELPFVDSLSYSYKINDAGGGSVTVPLGGTGMSKADFEEISKPWHYSVAICYKQFVVQAGPVMGESYTDNQGKSQLTFAGMWKYLSKRLVLPPTWVAGANPAVSGADTLYANTTWRNIAIQLVADTTTRNSLPIVTPTLDAASTVTQQYYGYDMSLVADALTNVTSLSTNVELEFRPTFSATPGYIQWTLRAGSPRLGQIGAPWVWDYGDRGSLTSLDYATDGSMMEHADYARGSGSQYNLAIGTYYDPTLVTAGYPLLEGVNGANTQETNTTTLASYAQATVQTYAYPVATFSATVRIDGTDGTGQLTGSPTIDQVSVGDTGTFCVQRHRRIPDGNYTLRITGIDSVDYRTAKLTLQSTAGVA